MPRGFDIFIENLSKIEGHTDLDVKVRDGKVQDVKLRISENKRFYTQAVRGKNCLSIHQLVSRICGTCSIAHMTACVDCVENMLGVVPSAQTRLLRNLTMDGLMIRDHAMHLYLFSLPDIYGKDSVLEFEGEQKELVRKAFIVKSAGNELSKWIAGRSVHATYPQVGYYASIPDKAKAGETVRKLREARVHALEFADIFHKSDLNFGRKTQFVALANPNYNFIGGEIHTSQNLCIPKELFWDHLHRVVIPYSQATGFEFEGKEYMVGALARMNLNRDNIRKETRADVSEYLRVFPSANIFHNNLAQAIEVVHCIDDDIALLESFDTKPEPKPEVKTKAAAGVGVIEAPRGTLYYKMKVDGTGKILEADLVIPTAQNQVNMEADIKVLVEQNLDKGKDVVQCEIEKLIRAYDPCMSCATHFLKINWIKV
ncbi:Sulfhydrogenase 1 subunit alpha [uncultured archaeon]|nr:Sulfhydrogenase 1 subunit alpha [uncultured archaeon]